MIKLDGRRAGAGMIFICAMLACVDRGPQAAEPQAVRQSDAPAEPAQVKQTTRTRSTASTDNSDNTGAHQEAGSGGDSGAGSGNNALPTVTVSGTRSIPEANQSPGTTESVTARQLGQTVNAVDLEDALKYLPDVLVRKRYIGDTQAPMATRTTGINASARSLIYVDGVLLSTLINNNNANGSPQWFMVAPQQVARIDLLYGPFAAAYPGNSYGAVTEITTRMPTRLEASADVTTAWQNFKLYGTDQSFPAQQYTVTLGDKVGRLSWFFSANHLDSFSQPITFGSVAQSTTPAGASLPIVNGGYADSNRLGAPVQLIGASNFTHTIQDDVTLRARFAITPTLSATYGIGYWQNRSKATSESYLKTADGQPYYGAAGGNLNLGGFQYSAASLAQQYMSNNVEQEHLMQSFNLKSNTGGLFDWNLVLSNFEYLQDLSRLSTGLYPSALTGGPGRTTDMSGTGWFTADLNGVLRPTGRWAANTLRFGAHFDQFKLDSPTYNTDNFAAGSNGALFSNSAGNTQTSAFWLQDVWRLSRSVSATLGGRYERWHAYNGANLSTASSGNQIAIQQPTLDRSGFSPKASLSWDLTDTWSVTGSFGRALRFPTVGELYQTVQTGSTYLQANPYLKPESVLSGELAVVRQTEHSKLRVSLFDEVVSNALISQTSLIAGFATPVSFTQNVDKTRETGIEIAAQHDDVLLKGLALSGNLTYVNARILADSGYVPTVAGASAVGSQTPYVPTWRATLAATYRPDEKWAYTVAGRYSSRVYGTVDNTDVNAATFQGFQSFLVVDVRANYQVDHHWSIAAGVDNLNNRQYFLYHPFPQRTFYAELKYIL